MKRDGLRSPKRKALLSGLCSCGICEGTITASWSGKENKKFQYTYVVIRKVAVTEKQSMQSIWKNTFYLCHANAIVILNPEFDDFDEYINTTMIKIAGGIYPLTKFVRSDYDLQDNRNVN